MAQVLFKTVGFSWSQVGQKRHVHKSSPVVAKETSLSISWFSTVLGDQMENFRTSYFRKAYPGWRWSPGWHSGSLDHDESPFSTAWLSQKVPEGNSLIGDEWVHWSYWKMGTSASFQGINLDVSAKSPFGHIDTSWKMYLRHFTSTGAGATGYSIVWWAMQEEREVAELGLPLSAALGTSQQALGRLWRLSGTHWTLAQRLLQLGRGFGTWKVVCWCHQAS